MEHGEDRLELSVSERAAADVRTGKRSTVNSVEVTWPERPG